VAPSLRRLLERRIDELPLTLRAVFVLREVEGLSVRETAACLGIPESTVRRRAVRARARLRALLSRDFQGATLESFTFVGGRGDRIVATVLARLTRGSKRIRRFAHPKTTSRQSFWGSETFP
jgi:RNA polymerase sigma-70 factor (ECF subfamily)